MNARQILQSALDRFGPNGEHWTKGAFERDGSFCTVGSLREDIRHGDSEFFNKPEYLMAKNLLAVQVKALTGNEYQSLMSFNDAAETTFAAVRRVFQKAINRAAHRVIYKVA